MERDLDDYYESRQKLVDYGALNHEKKRMLDQVRWLH